MALDILDERPAASWSASRTGLIATAVAAALVVMLLGVISVAANRDGLGPPPAIPSSLPLGLLYGAPAAIGWLGSRSARRTLLTAAGLLYLPLAVLAFSGVTLPFLLPALLYLRAAATREPVASQPERLRPRGRSSRRSLIALAAVLMSVPIVLWIVVSLGIFGLVGVVVVAGLAPTLERRVQPTPRTARLAGSAGRRDRSSLTRSRPRRSLPSSSPPPPRRSSRPRSAAGSARTPRAVPCSGRSLGRTRSPCRRAGTAGGCDGGVYTPTGIALESCLLVAAIGTALLVTRTRPTARELPTPR